jgi:hypothetical protein
MSRVCEPPRAVFIAATKTLADNVVRALTGADGVFHLADNVSRDNPLAGLAAVRILGPDVLAPFTVAGHVFTTSDAEVVATSLATFPDSGLDSGGDDSLLVARRARDWATSQLLARLGVDEGLVAVPPPGALRGDDCGWLPWTTTLARLSPLASVGLDSPLHQQARRRRLDIARGVTRSMMRQDLLTAARLTRWLVASSTDRAAHMPLQPEPVLGHVELLADADPQLVLEIIMTRRGLRVVGGG